MEETIIGYMVYLEEKDDYLRNEEEEIMWFNSKKEVREYLEMKNLKGVFILIPAMRR